MMKVDESLLHGLKYKQIELKYNYVPELMRGCIPMPELLI